jgi:ribokinase
MNYDVIGYGALNMDRMMLVDKIPGVDEEGYVLSVEHHPGGSAANTIVGLARLGLRTGYIGKVGTDEDGEFLMENMRREGVDTRCVKVCEGNSGVALCLVDRKGNRALLITSGVNDTIGIDDIDLDYIRKAGFLHLTSFIGKKSFETQKGLIDLFPGKISFDPGQLYAERGMKEMGDIISNSTVIFASEREVELLTDCDYDYRKGASVLLDEGVRIVAVTRGERGCYVTNGREEYDIPAEKTDVVDTTGAGDAFNAGFLFGLIKGKSLKECGRLGNKAASLCIRRNGTRDGLPMVLD